MLRKCECCCIVMCLFLCIMCLTLLIPCALPGLNQLGLSNYVYIPATHTRFEHSLGVAHLSERLCESLRAKQPNLNITRKDVICVKLAGLLHDLGHGPFSHLYDGEFRMQLALKNQATGDVSNSNDSNSDRGGDCSGDAKTTTTTSKSTSNRNRSNSTGAANVGTTTTTTTSSSSSSSSSSSIAAAADAAASPPRALGQPYLEFMKKYGDWTHESSSLDMIDAGEYFVLRVCFFVCMFALARWRESDAKHLFTINI